MAFPELDAGLLQPTLTEADDVTGFKKPWDPRIIPVIGFVFGLTAAGILFGLNYPRLGMPRKPWPLIVGAVAITLGFWMVVWLGVILNWWLPVSGHSVRTLFTVLTIALSLLVARQQSSRYRLAVYTDCELGSLWIPGIAASAVGAVVQYYSPEAAFEIIRPFFERVR